MKMLILHTFYVPRPLQCPESDCKKHISSKNLEGHFKYEHKEVPVVLSQLDTRSALEFYPRDVRYNITQCIVLLNIISHDFSNIFPQSSPPGKTDKLIMLLLVTKISNLDLIETEEDGTTFSTQLRQEITTEKTSTFLESGVLSPNDKIIIWLASNHNINLNYTVAVSMLTSRIRQKYCGPMLSLCDNPIDLCRRGTCLMLNHFQVNGMTENGTKPLALDVVLHST